MNQTLRLFALIFAGMVIAATIWQWSHLASMQRAPVLTFTLLDGSQVSMSALRGKPLLVVFWSVTCTPCVREIPRLAALYQDLHPHGLDLIAVASPTDPPVLVADFARRFKVPYPVALDTNGAAARAFGGVLAIPRDILITSNGRIIANHIGPVDWAGLRARVVAMLPNGSVGAVARSKSSTAHDPAG